MWLRTWLLAVLMLVGGPAADVIAQQAPARPAPERPQRREREKPTEKPADKPADKPTEKPAPEPRTCCRTCSKGKACGNSCIQRQLTCHKPPGCACDAGSN